MALCRGDAVGRRRRRANARAALAREMTRRRDRSGAKDRPRTCARDQRSDAGAVMNVDEAIKARISVRAFKPDASAGSAGARDPGRRALRALGRQSAAMEGDRRRGRRARRGGGVGARRICPAMKANGWFIRPISGSPIARAATSLARTCTRCSAFRAKTSPSALMHLAQQLRILRRAGRPLLRHRQSAWATANGRISACSCNRRAGGTRTRRAKLHAGSLGAACARR